MTMVSTVSTRAMPRRGAVGAARVAWGRAGTWMTSRTTTRARTRLRRRARANANANAKARRDDSSTASASASAASVGENRSFDAAIESTAARGLEEALATVDERLATAMRGEAPSTSDANDDVNDALTRRRLGEEAEREAVEVMRCLRRRGDAAAFGAARGVPKRDYSLAELRLNDIEAEKLLAPTESTIKGIRDTFTRALVVTYAAGIALLHPTFAQGAGIATFAAFCSAYDQIAFGGGVSALALDTVAQATSNEYVTRLRRHEAAHFLTAYLVGILPKGYTLSSLDAFKTYGAFNIQAGCAFCDGEFQREVQQGKITSTSLDRFACVAMAGICMEYILFGFAEGGLSDVRQLDGLLQALAFTQKKSDSQVRWAVLNTTSLLRRHLDLTETLAEYMARGASVGECVALIEREVAKKRLEGGLV